MSYTPGPSYIFPECFRHLKRRRNWSEAADYATEYGAVRIYIRIDMVNSTYETDLQFYNAFVVALRDLNRDQDIPQKTLTI